MMNIIKVSTEEQFDETGAGMLASLLQAKPRAILGLATGSTPLGVYQRLITLCREGRISFKQVVTFNLDEYVGLSPDHPKSYRKYMNEKLFHHVDIDLGNTHIPSGTAVDLNKAVADYNRLLEEAGQIDLQLLGVGHNGHIGFNEPAEELISQTHIVKLDGTTRLANARFFPTVNEVPTYAITMGIGSIMQAKQILLMAKGADKAEVIARALQGPITTRCPASLLQTHSNVIVLLDQAAGGNLK